MCMLEDGLLVVLLPIIVFDVVVSIVVSEVEGVAVRVIDTGTVTLDRCKHLFISLSKYMVPPEPGTEFMIHVADYC
jgi:hypothetical protein